MGFMSAEGIERMHRKFCKYMLNVKISTNNYAVYYELGRYPLIVERQCRIVKYWSTLLQNSKKKLHTEKCLFLYGRNGGR